MATIDQPRCVGVCVTSDTDPQWLRFSEKRVNDPILPAGQIVLSGVRTARGYVGRPDLTASKFIPNPFYGDLVARGLIPKDLARHYERIYCSGDLGRWTPDGQIDYLGRIDRQVKLNGVRIELGELETIIAQAEGGLLSSTYPCNELLL